MLDLAVSLLNEICRLAIPCSLVFYIGYLIVDSFYRFAFDGGRLWRGR